MTDRLTLSQGYAQGLGEEMARDDRIFVLGTDIFGRGGHWAQVKGLGARFGPERIRNTPISESAMVAAGVGAALNGQRPVVDLNFVDFSLSAMDEIANQAAKARYMWGTPVPMVIRGTCGVAGGAAQHNNSIESWFAHLPGLVVAMPATAADAKGMIKSALRGEDPVVFLMHKMLTGARGPVGGPDTVVPLGSARIARPGRDVTVIAYSIMVSKAIAAADALAADGVDVEVVDLRTVSPIDMDTVAASVTRTGRAVVAAEAPLQCSVAAEMAARIQEDLFDVLAGPVLRVGGRHTPIAHSPVLFQASIPKPTDVVAAVRTAMSRDVRAARS